ncbi:hypothetical protein RBU49_02245 [Clostridium sp. MB40-C1]|uniref:hypothetical protein n=1 Tax=Clostridium sp. MB40-C1 TaxID=3070996 RepID=UPI0027E0613A|nr:hypothetical protein [Clostridium sp. MB40-C1]WMJ81097.1 hypothetical protein RBU49_02245 [Clostridium sp. MB40-C1]
MCLRRISLSMVLFLIISLLMGCSGGSYKISKGDIKASDNSINGNYGSFTGNYFKKVKFEKNEDIKFDFEISNIKGKISAKVKDSQENTVAEIDKSKLVKMDKADTYTIQVEGENHEGGFVLTWNVN